MMDFFLTQEFLIGGKHHRFKRGYKNVIDEAIRLVRFGVGLPFKVETSHVLRQQLEQMMEFQFSVSGIFFIQC